MQHRMDDAKLEEWESRRGKIIEREELDDPDISKALYHSHTDEAGNFYIPSEHLRMAFINAGSFVKSKVGNARKSMKNIVAAMFTITPDAIRMPRFDQIDKRSAVNRAAKARVITIRPKWSEWKAEFELIVDNDTITESTIKDIISYAGAYVGIGSYRPTNNGPFGRFELSVLEKTKAE